MNYILKENHGKKIAIVENGIRVIDALLFAFSIKIVESCQCSMTIHCIIIRDHLSAWQNLVRWGWMTH